MAKVVSIIDGQPVEMAAPAHGKLSDFTRALAAAKAVRQTYVGACDRLNFIMRLAEAGGISADEAAMLIEFFDLQGVVIDE